MHLLALKAASVLAAAGLAAGGATQLRSSENTETASAQQVVRVYIVESGNTLSGIAGEFCGNPADYPALAAASGIRDANDIYVGERIVLACSAPAAPAQTAPVQTASAPTGSSYASGSADIPGADVVYSEAGLYRLWISAGGSAARASIAACIAEHESSGRTWVVSPTDDWGLWQIHDGGYAMLNAFANTQRAIAMSDDGTNWSQWTTHIYCGV